MINRTLWALCGLVLLSTGAQAQECVRTVSGKYLDCGSAGFGTFVGGRLYMEPAPPRPEASPLTDWMKETTARPTCPRGFICTPVQK